MEATTTPAPTEPLFPQPLLDALSRHPDRTAFEHGSRAVSYGELLAMVRRLTAGLRDAGLGPGRGVATLTAATPEAFAANVAVHALGCRVAGIRPGWSPPQLASALGGGTDAIVGDPASLAPGPGPSALRRLAGPAPVLSLGAHPGATDLLARSGGGEPVAVAARPDDIARLHFTSGSTGRPKGCARTYRTFSLAFRPDRWAPDLARLVGHFERFLVSNSLAVPVMLTFAARCLITGGTAVIPDGDARADMPAAIDRHGVTGVVMTVPTLHRMLALLRDEPRHLALRALVVTGSPAGPGLLAAAVDHLGPLVWQGYGQAESGMISLLTPADIARSPDALTSVGRPLPDVEISVRDPEGRPVGPGETGEICVRSPHVMAGYWGDPQQTHEVLRAGWLHTRDLGRLDATGLLRLTGRSRDVIIVNAEVCYAGAIEQALARHPDVDQAYVVGVPHEPTGEKVHAFVVPATDRAPDRDALAGLVRSELNENHVPATITVVPDVPLAASGKPDKHRLAELAARGGLLPPLVNVGPAGRDRRRSWFVVSSDVRDTSRLAIAAKTARRIWTHPENRGVRLRRLAGWVGWQAWERVVRRPWTIPFHGGLRMICHPHDTVASLALYCGLYDSEEMRFLLAWLRPRDTLVDVGANVAPYSLLATLVPDVRAVAFEPGSLALRRARANIDLNGVGDRIELVPLAVSRGEGSVRLSADGCTTNSLVDAGYEGAIEEVEAVTLDGFDAGGRLGRVGMVKIDVEGHELAVLRGAVGVLRRHRPALVVELNDVVALRRFAESEGYTAVRFVPGTGALRPRPWQAERGGNILLVADLEAARRRLAASGRG